MIKHQLTRATGTQRLSAKEQAARESATEMHEALVDRGMEYLAANINGFDVNNAIAYRRKVRDAISSTVINTMMLEANIKLAGSFVFELSRERGSRFSATVIKNNFGDNPCDEDRKDIIRAVNSELILL